MEEDSADPDGDGFKRVFEELNALNARLESIEKIQDRLKKEVESLRASFEQNCRNTKRSTTRDESIDKSGAMGDSRFMNNEPLAPQQNTTAQPASKTPAKGIQTQEEEHLQDLLQKIGGPTPQDLVAEYVSETLNFSKQFDQRQKKLYPYS